MNSSKETGRQAARNAYLNLVARLSPKSKLAQGLLRAFWVGGLICALGQGLSDAAGSWLKLTATESSAFASICLVFLTALLTGLGVFDKLGQYAGAGSFVPITGFANAVVSPAIEFKAEGFVTGMAAKMFVIAGPVIVYGTLASVVYGVVLWALG